MLLCWAAWHLDHDAKEASKDKEFFKKASLAGDPKFLDPGLQTEYAKSWLEGRNMGEESRR
jgi:hypothetical protein